MVRKDAVFTVSIFFSTLLLEFIYLLALYPAFCFRSLMGITDIPTSIKGSVKREKLDSKLSSYFP